MNVGNLVVKAKEDFVIDNAYGVNVAGDMSVDAKTMTAKGAKLESSSDYK